VTVADLVVGLLQMGHRVRAHVGGDSMDPAIQSGDTVIIAPLSSSLAAEDLLGQIVLCQDDFGRLRLHRLVRRCPANPGRFITRGDNLASYDLPLDASQLLGRVVLLERSWTRRLLRLAQSLAGVRLFPAPAKL
jgi:hypothetical protein